MEITNEELRALLASSNGDKYIFDRDTTFIKEQNITVQSGANFYNGSQPKPNKGKKESEENPLVLQLMPIFKDNEEYVTEFLSEIEGKKALDITNAVVRFRDAKKLSAQLCHHSLWQILSDNNIYTLTERNWNERIKY